jgi:ABC-type transport system involved in multi-copper enzyme maturation permease subunit
MLGPVFGAEMLRAGRRGRAHVLRWLYAGWLALQLLYLHDQYAHPRLRGPARPDTPAFARHTLDLILGQQLLLVALVTPAFVAGAVTDEKTRGTLDHLMTSPLRPADIVLGKLLARAAQVGALALTPLPVVIFIGPYAGVTPEFLVALVAVTALLIFGLGAVSLLASVWTRQTRTAVLLTYALVGGLWAVASSSLITRSPTRQHWFAAFEPLRPLTPALDRADPAEAWRRLGEAALAWGALGGACTLLAAWRLRPAYLRQRESRPRGRFGLGRLDPRPRPKRDALAWKECYVGRRLPLWLGLPLACAVTAAVTLERQPPPAARPGAAGEALLVQGWWVLLLLSLVVGVRGSGCVSGERERQTWDGLLVTPLPTGELVRGKLRGILGAAWPYLLGYYLTVAVTLVLTDAANLRPLAFLLPWAAAAAGVVWLEPRALRAALFGLTLGVALTAGLEVFVITLFGLGITWLVMYFLGAVGLYCSARSHSSWRSLLGTVALGYAGGFALLCVSTPLSCLSLLVLGLVTTLVEGLRPSWFAAPAPQRYLALWGALWPVFWAVGSAVAYWWVARSLLTAAENHIAKHDRIPTGRVRQIDLNLPTRALHRRLRS